MTERKLSSYDHNAFFSNFHGMEDLAYEAIQSFLATLPSLISALEKAVMEKNAKNIETSAHTLKGSVSNFHANVSVQMAKDLELMGKSKALEGAEKLFFELKIELKILNKELQGLVDEQKVA